MTIQDIIDRRESKMFAYYKSMFVDGFEGGYNAEYDDELKNLFVTLRQEIEGFLKDENRLTPREEWDEERGYNRAILDVLALLDKHELLAKE